MEGIARLLTVAGLGMIELWAAIPAGFVLQLHPVAAGSAAASGAILGTLMAVLLGERLRAYLVRRHGEKAGTGRHRLLQRVWLRHGVVGLGLLAPLITGAPLGAALALALGAPAGRVLLWASLGVILWATGLTLAVALGVVGVGALRP